MAEFWNPTRTADTADPNISAGRYDCPGNLLMPLAAVLRISLKYVLSCVDAYSVRTSWAILRAESVPKACSRLAGRPIAPSDDHADAATLTSSDPDQIFCRRGPDTVRPEAPTGSQAG